MTKEHTVTFLPTMNDLFNKTKQFVFKQQTSMLASSLILAGMMIVSRFAGFMRYRMLAGYFSKDELDIFFAAFRIPDLVFEVLINGALSTTFIPFFIKYEKREEQHKIISSIINTVLLVLSVTVVILAIIMPYVVPIMTPGFSQGKVIQIVFFSRILLLGQLPLLILGNFLTGMSQSKKMFIIPAVAPVVYNLAIIFSTFFFASSLHLLAPVLGVVAGAVLFLLTQIPVVRYIKFKYKLVLSHARESLQFFRTAIPRVLTIIVSQIDATVDLSLATLLGSGSYTIFYLAQHLQLLPVSIVGISVGQASLPYISELYQEKKYDALRKIVISTLLNILYMAIPAAAFFAIMRTATVRIFFGGDKFDWDATVATAITLSFFCISIPFHAMYYFVTRCYYAFFDTKTPFYTSSLAIGLNALLSVIFILGYHMPVWSLAVAFSISMSLHVILLLVLLHKKIGMYNVMYFFQEIVKMLVATFNSALITFVTVRLLDGLILDTSRTINVFILLTIGFGLFSTIYIFLSWFFGIQEAYVLSKMLPRVRLYGQKIIELYTGISESFTR
ncbi:murein biosynthesis integral membrane protein MurJ [Candidatus Woesebacteria bacterium]|nr:murein biosynthesis integral membrane protein MurJ [Candidatus Woesebacteria bacterium]